jgi:hypothetical protein
MDGINVSMDDESSFRTRSRYNPSTGYAGFQESKVIPLIRISLCLHYHCSLHTMSPHFSPEGQFRSVDVEGRYLLNPTTCNLAFTNLKGLMLHPPSIHSISHLNFNILFDISRTALEFFCWFRTKRFIFGSTNKLLYTASHRDGLLTGFQSIVSRGSLKLQKDVDDHGNCCCSGIFSRAGVF